MLIEKPNNHKRAKIAAMSKTIYFLSLVKHVKHKTGLRDTILKILQKRGLEISSRTGAAQLLGGSKGFRGLKLGEHLEVISGHK